MSAGAPDLTPPPDWADLLGETRAILQLDDDPVPVEELVETAVDHGYGTDVDGLPPKKAVRRALRDADVLEAAGDLDYVRLADETPEPSDSGEIEGRGAGSSGDDPQGETDETGEANGAAALDDAVEWFTEQLDRTIDDHTESGDHPDRPTTAREWFTDVRGYDEATVEEKRLGWAPAGAADRLVEYLHRNGHGREAILATGLFTEDLRLLWNGRYVFPYLDRDGRAAYAIGRTTGSLGGGGAGYDGHPEDFLAGKYAKLAHTRDYVTVEEPIYGLGSLDRDTPVLITEGVADAVRAHEAGYACLSPVTTQFKKEHREQLVDVLDDTGRRAYIVQDAERPVVEHSEEAEGWDALAVEQYGEGVKGAARTAAFLTDAGVEAYLAELPRLGLDKVDLDDYLGEWADTLAPVLAGAKPGDEHPAYAETTPSVSPSTSASGGESWGGSEASSSGGSGADLTKADVKDALDHVSSTLSYDEWIQLGYAVHAWDGGEDGKEVFTEWSERSPKWEEPTSPNAIDWIWSNASGVEESAEGKVTVGTLVARAKKGGWEPASGRTDPVAALPLATLDTLDHDEARRFASKRGVEWPTTREVRERLRNDIFEVMHHGDVKILDAPTASGKSYTVAAERWRDRVDTTGGQPVVQLSETRKARDQAAADSDEANVAYEVLRGRTEACPVAAGRHDPAAPDSDDEDPEIVITVGGVAASEWFETVCEGRGIPFSVAHQYLADHNDQGVEPPCCDGDGAECPAIAQWDGLPRDDEGEPVVDVIHATHGFAHVPSLRNGTNVVFDERPDFTTDLSHDRVRRAVAAYLVDASAPVATFEEFVATVLDGDPPNEHAEHPTVRDALEHDPNREWYLETDGAHTLAPALTRAIYYALLPDDDEVDATDPNGRYSATVPHEPPRLDAEANDDDGWNRAWVSVVLDSQNTVRVVRNTPDMSAARSVLGLDAHPSMVRWQRNVHPDILVEPVLGIQERALWRRYERGLLTVGVGDATRPLTSGEYFDEDGTRTFLAALRERFGDRFRTAITAGAVEHRTEQLLDDVGVGNPETMHYGEEKSRGDFGDEDIGALNGCIDPGDDFVLDLLAEADLEATPETTTDGDGEEHRAHGRGFEGRDAELAAELLASVREQHVAQGAGRYARNADDPEDRAVVFVRTDAAPPGFLDLQVPGVEWLATDAQREIVEALQDRPHATARELAEAVDVSKEHVRQTLERLQEDDVVDRQDRAGDYGAHLYRAVAGLTGGGRVDLDPEPADETANGDVRSVCTWSLAVSPTTAAGSVAREDTVGTTPGDTTTGGSAQAGLSGFEDGAPPE